VHTNVNMVKSVVLIEMLNGTGMIEPNKAVRRDVGREFAMTNSFPYFFFLN
jgi:hypothetical protein